MTGGFNAGGGGEFVVIGRVARNADGADDTVIAVANQNAAADRQDPTNP